MADPILRPLVAADLAATVAMQRRAMAVLGRTHYTDEQTALLLAATEAPDYPGELLANDLWVAVDPAGAVIGSAGWGAVPGAARGRIRKVFVEPDLAGRGLGRRLVEAAEARAGAAGRRGFVVRANLNAVAFYERLGYRATGPGAMTVAGGATVPMTMMEKLSGTGA
jgi:putative acetyltransferase